MACALTTGRAEPCKDSVGGLKAVYFVDFGDLGAATYAASSDTISAFAGTYDAFKFDLRGTSSFEQTINSSRDNGTTFYEQTLNLQLKKMDSATHNELALLVVARPHVFIEDNNGDVFIAGLEFGMDVSGGTLVTGAAMGDLSGYTLTLTGMEKKPANFFTGTISASATQITP